MFGIPDFFASLEGCPHPELFEVKLEGFDDLVYVWDVLKRIQAGFVAKKVVPKIAGIVEEGAWLKGEDIVIGKNSVIEAGAMVQGPTIIGSNVTVRHGAYIRGHVIVGDHAVVGHCSEVIRSVIMSHAKAPHFNYVGDSILGAGVNLGAGTKLSNLKNDGSPVIVRVGATQYKTGLRKFGAILGDRCQFGCNSVSNPGTMMGPGCLVYPNATVAGYVRANVIVKLRPNLELADVDAGRRG